MRDDLGHLLRLDAIVERQVQVERHLDRLVARDQRGERDDAAIAGREAGALPHVAEQAVLRILLEGRGDHTYIGAGQV